MLPRLLSLLSRPHLWLLGLCALLLLLGGYSQRGAALSFDPTPPRGRDGTAVLVFDLKLSASQAAIATPPTAASTAKVRVFHGLPDGRWAALPERTLSGLGRSEVFGLPSGPAWVVVERQGYARASVRCVLYEADAQRAEVHSITLTTANSLTIRVQTEDGSGLPGATVIARSGPALPFAGLSDKDGIATLTGLPQGPHKVEVFARGYAASSVEASDATTVVLRQLGKLTIDVRGPDAAPAAGAEVWLVGAGIWPARRLVVDAAGEASVTNVPDGLLSLRAVKGDLVSETLSGVHLRQGEQRRVALVLRPGHFVDLTVREELSNGGQDAGRPIAGARIVLAEQGLSAFPLTAVTDEKGGVRAGPLAGASAYVSARAEGFVSKALSLALNDAVVSISLNLPRVGSVKGTVVDEHGDAVQGAEVEVIGTDLDGQPIDETPLLAAYREAHFQASLRPLELIKAGDLGVTQGPIPFVDAVVSRPSLSFGNAGLETANAIDAQWQSDAKGRFRAYPVPPGKVRITARHPDFSNASSESVDLAPGGSAEVQVVMTRGATLKARVLDERGFPVENTRVAANGVSTAYERVAWSDAYGQVTFGGLPAKFTVSLARAEDPTRFVLRVPLEVESGATLERDLTLPEKREAVTFRVLDERDEPIELTQVTALSVDPAVPIRSTRFTDREGEALFDDLRGVPLRITANCAGYLSQTLQLAKAPAEVRLVLRRGVNVEGSVTTLGGRREVVGARITLSAEGYREQTSTSKYGDFHLSGVPPGPVEIRVEHPEYAPAQFSQSVTAPTRDDRSFELSPIDLSDGVNIEGSVQDAEGAALAGVRVSTEFLPAYLPRGAIRLPFVQSDEDGRFTLNRVAPGSRVLYALAPTRARGELRLEIDARQDVRDVVIRLAPAPTADVSETPSAGLAVTLAEANGHIHLAHVAANSEAEYSGLRGDDEVVSIDGEKPADVSEARRRISGAAGSDVVLEVLRSGETLHLRVRREELRR